MPIRFGALRDGGPCTAHPGIVVGTIEPSVGFHSFADHGFHGSCLGDINLDESGITAIFLDHMDSLPSTIFVHIRDNQFGTFPGKGQGGGSANP
jgi:hypothetical protein